MMGLKGGVLGSFQMVEGADYFFVASERDTGTFLLGDVLCVPFYLVGSCICVYGTKSQVTTKEYSS